MTRPDTNLQLTVDGRLWHPTRSKLPENLALTSLSGAVSTSPRKDNVWNRQSEDFTDSPI
jgi:hypothetical protein